MLITGALAFGAIKGYQYITKPEKAHYHAGFQVYVDGKLQDFSGIEYMNTVPCTDRHELGESTSPEEIQKDKAHLHDEIGDVVHAHVTGGTWGDLFTNMKYDFPSGKEVQGYIDGKPIDDIRNYPIKPYDSVIILVGSNKPIETYQPNAVTKETIIEAENMSETCGSE